MYARVLTQAVLMVVREGDGLSYGAGRVLGSGCLTNTGAYCHVKLAQQALINFKGTVMDNAGFIVSALTQKGCVTGAHGPNRVDDTPFVEKRHR